MFGKKLDQDPKSKKKWTTEDYLKMRQSWENGSLCGWKIFYSDGTTLTSKDCKFVDAPNDGIEVLIKYYKTKTGYSREIQNGLDLYLLKPIDALEIADQLPNKVKIGRNLPYGEFRKILDSARAENKIVSEMI